MVQGKALLNSQITVPVNVFFYHLLGHLECPRYKIGLRLLRAAAKGVLRKFRQGLEKSVWNLIGSALVIFAKV